MKRDRIALFPDHPRGTIQANRIGAFVQGGITFDVIRPGYDIQGRRKVQWTQVVHGGYPIFTHRLGGSELSAVLERFERLWQKDLTPRPDLLEPALAATKQTLIDRFRDGVTGEAPAPALTTDGRPTGERYDT